MAFMDSTLKKQEREPPSLHRSQTSHKRLNDMDKSFFEHFEDYILDVLLLFKEAGSRAKKKAEKAGSKAGSGGSGEEATFPGRAHIGYRRNRKTETQMARVDLGGSRLTPPIGDVQNKLYKRNSNKDCVES
uniref:LNP1 n=1 Tax=Steinernema glaseri TaxID=37863 RepID=A0A1I8A152_9BILA